MTKNTNEQPNALSKLDTIALEVFTNKEKGIDSNQDLDAESEKLYNEVSREIVDTSREQLVARHNNKNELRKSLSKFFKWFLSLQYLVLVVFLIFQGLGLLKLSTEIIITYITSVFVETLGGLIAMVKFAFESTQENQIMEIMHNFLKDFKKHSDNNH